MQVPPGQAQPLLEASINRTQQVGPDLSAQRLLSAKTRRAVIGVVLLFVLGLIISWRATLVVVIGIITLVYVAVIVDRVILYVRSRSSTSTIRISNQEALAADIEDLPVYTVLVPLYGEPEVVGRLVGHLECIDYPRDRLDVIFLIEADDRDTITAVRDVAADEHMKAVLVPAGGPRTKPKALNYGLEFARGDIVTIYDAEDRPEPLQLRKAALALARSEPEVACLQAKLAFWNVDQNLITRWFAIEYAMWFWLFLPGLVDMESPVPLGGTSNHFRRQVLQEIGEWDPYNVTEDADLGIRLARLGYRCKMLDTVTLEEANSDFVNWIKQRSRWYKGYFQTTIVHLRHPVEVYRQFGARGFWAFLLFVGGTPTLAALNSFFWLLTLIWFSGGHAHVIQELFPGPVFYVATASWIFGNFVALYMTVLTCRISGRPELLWAALLVPIYWVMMALAALKALWQLVVTPTFWEKTAHGLDEPPIAASG